MALPFANTGQPRGPVAPTPLQATNRESLESPVGGGTTAPAARHESVLDANATFEGTFKAEQDVRIQGSLSGDISCRGLLTIDRTATVRARIEAHDIAIYGNVEGEIVCTGRFELGSTAIVSANVKAGSIVVEEGAALKGTVEAGQRT